MKILLVEDNPDDLFLAKHELIQLGHYVIDADNGAAALELYGRERPDLVITDIYMPGMDGFALTRAVQKLAAPRWQPVLFLSGHRDDSLQVKALQVGADAYVVKPVSAEMLDARLGVIQRLLTIQRQAEERAGELERYYAAEEEDKRIAQHLLGRLVNMDKLADPAIRYWVSAAAMFSGDLAAAARTPGNALHVLLADGTGHGLAASINVLPVIEPFYRMTEKGFGIDSIAREMNTKVRHVLPKDRFVAATLATINFREGYVRIWNGGNPEPFMLNPGGYAEHVFAVRHPPLGALGDDEFETHTETHACSPATQLILYSDGVIEAENGDGGMFGFERLADTLVNAPIDRRLECVVDAITDHLAGQAARDDISLVVINCHDGALAAEAPPAAPALVANPGNWHFSLRLGAVEISRVDVVPLLLGLTNQFDGARDRSGELFLILSELFNNALDHGLLQLDSRLKLGGGGMEDFLREREVRLSTLREGEIEFVIDQYVQDDRIWLRIVCRDSGPGFRPAETGFGEAADVSELPFGRGLALVRAMTTSLEFNPAGNCVTATLALMPASL